MLTCDTCGFQTPRRVYHRGSKTVVPAQLPAVKQLLLKWCPPVCRGCGDDPCNPLTPSLVATVGVTLAPGVVDTDVFDWSGAFLVVDYGSGDPDLQTVDLDLLNGDSFPLIGGGGQYVNFWIVYPRVVLNDVLVTPDIEVSISVGEHGYGGTGPRSTRRSVLVGDIFANTASALLPIPRYAVAAVFQSTDGTAALSFQQFADPLAGAFQLSQQTLSKLEYKSVPVLHGARAFTVTGGPEVGSTDVRVIFYLAPA